VVAALAVGAAAGLVGGFALAHAATASSAAAATVTTTGGTPSGAAGSGAGAGTGPIGADPSSFANPADQNGAAVPAQPSGQPTTATRGS